MTSKLTTIAFFGLGKMGAPMARHLLSSGHALRLFDPNPEVLKPFQNQNSATCCKSAIDAVKGAEITISMLMNGNQVRELYCGENGVLQQLSPGALAIDCSTIDLESARSVAEAAKTSKLHFVDAPVSGGVAGAEAGTLTFMLGGSADAVARAQEVLEPMGRQCFYAGDSGSGQLAKMCNNLLLAIHMTGTAEALNLGARNGLDLTVLSNIMKASSGDNWSLERYNPAPNVDPDVPSSRDFAPGFTVSLMLKDLGLAIDNSLSCESALPLGSLVRNLYITQSESQKDNLHRDFSSIWELYQPKHESRTSG